MKMKLGKMKKKLVALCMVLTQTVMTLQICTLPVNASNGSLTQEEAREIVSTYSAIDSIPGYLDYLENHKDADYPDVTMEINAADYTVYMENDREVEPEIYTNYEGMQGESILTSETSYIEFEVEVSEPGFYQLELEYYPIEGKNSEIQRSFFVDGELPYGELSLIEFPRIWSTDVAQASFSNGVYDVVWNKDNQGNDMKPTAVEIPEWIVSDLYDNNGYITEPLCIYLAKGKHTISMNAQREPMLLRRLLLTNKEDVKSYEEVKKQWDAAGGQNTTGVNIVIQGENATRTSSQMLYPKQDQSSPAVYPASAKELLNNTIGGESWGDAGQWIEWEFEVPETGYYNISLFDKQSFMRGIYVSRKISIDGEVPFSELEDYGFTYDSSWRTDVLQDEEENAYCIYLEKGIHTIRMEVVLGEFSEVIANVQDCVSQLNAIYRKVIRITGVNPDTYRDYQIEASLPDLNEEMVVVRDQLNDSIEDLRAAAGRTSDKETVLITMRDQLDYLIEDEERFVKVVSTYKQNVRACGTWITQVIDQPLQIDRLNIYSPDEVVEVDSNSFFDKALYEAKRLYYSFVIDYNSLGATDTEDDENKTITLWIGTGRDQANVIRSLIDESFTNVYGVNVNVQLVDMNTLLRAELAGEGPDVAIQVANTNGIAGAVLNTGNDTPVNYGLRNAVLDLTQFADYEEVSERFYPSALTAFGFDGAVYALPETQTFPVMFYRQDILSELGIDVPTTWEEVKVTMSVLAKNQMEFGMLPSEQIYAMLLYQNGGEYYNEGGISSALDSDIAVNTFKEYCEYYTDYGLDRWTSVEERFRTGECPIIIADYTVYNNLEVSAPDIAGLWNFTVVPGTVQEDGTVDHSVGCTGLASMIMADTDEPEACWEFLKWWTSADVQTLFDREMESLMGSAARVATANQEAFENIPWSVDTYEALAEAFTWVKGIPQVPGGYYSWRNVNNAFYTVTTETDTASPREELMDKVLYINDEITYKRKEFGLPTLDDLEEEGK
ncbi:MAG: extracellular solute-binding protein [Lachnospiraceae bacterium]|nr:extracellular solute-binding protein [Lachnospiraceae bacterium]